MSMRMTFRWYGENDDKITLQQIDQIPGMDGIVGALFDIPVGEVWPVEPLLHIKKIAEENNLVCERTPAYRGESFLLQREQHYSSEELLRLTLSPQA